MCNLWRRGDDGIDRLVAVMAYDDLLRFVRKGSELGRYTWEML